MAKNVSILAMPAQYIRISTVLELPRRVLFALTPDLLRWRSRQRPVIGDVSKHSLASNSQRIEYLDGLRGLAAVAVLNYHYLFSFSSYATVGYGFDKQNQSLIQLPFVRLTYDGATAVIIFFVTAGYVSSAKPLQLMGEGLQAKTLHTLCASMFRSLLRLYLPVLLVSFICANAAYMGAFDHIRSITARERFPETTLRRHTTWSTQMHFWMSEMFIVTNLWHEKPFYPEHDPHLWSVSFEFRMRMHLYAALLALSLCKPKVRLCGLVAFAAMYFSWARWEGPLFFLGAALAQWQLILQRSSENTTAKGLEKRAAARFASFRDPVRWTLYVLALYLMSFPIKNAKRPAPGFAYLNHLIPHWYKPEKFPKSIGVVLFLYLLSTNRKKETSWWLRMLNSRIPQYLGRVMFALYLVHGPIAHTFGLGIPPLVWAWIGKDTNHAWWTGLIIGWLSNLLASLWLADVFTREVDARLARLTRWCESKVLTP